MSSTHLFNWLQQVFPWLCQARTSSTDFSKVFPWLYQTHPSPRLTSAGFSMTISNTPIASTDFSRIFHDYQTYPSPRLTSARCSMTMSSTHLFNWLQQAKLLKSVEAMVVFDIVMKKPAEVSRSGGCVWYSHGKTCWSQSRRCVCLI
jgi:hypothetical protein